MTCAALPTLSHPSLSQLYLLLITAHCLSFLSVFKTSCKPITIVTDFTNRPYTSKWHIPSHLLRDPTVSLLLAMVSSVLWVLGNEQHMHTHYTMRLNSNLYLHSIPASGPCSKNGSDITARWKPPSRDVPARTTLSMFILYCFHFIASNTQT